MKSRRHNYKYVRLIYLLAVCVVFLAILYKQIVTQDIVVALLTSFFVGLLLLNIYEFWLLKYHIKNGKHKNKELIVIEAHQLYIGVVAMLGCALTLLLYYVMNLEMEQALIVMSAITIGALMISMPRVDKEINRLVS